MIICFSCQEAALFWTVIGTIIETLVSFPAGSGEFDVKHRVAYLFFIDRIQYNDLLPIATAFRNIISGHRTVFRKTEACEGSGAIFRKCIRIEEKFRSTAFYRLAIEYALVL